MSDYANFYANFLYFDLYLNTAYARHYVYGVAVYKHHAVKLQLLSRIYVILFIVNGEIT